MHFNIMDKIIVLAPHSKCNNGYIRDCDTRAQYVAETLHQMLQHRKMDAEILLSTEYREDFDLNRLESRDRPWRRELEDKVLKYYRDPSIRHIWIMEMHSFPRHSWEVDKDEKMVIVSIPEFAVTGNKLANFLGKDVFMYHGTEKNDIQYSYAPFRDKVTVLFIESCEDESHLSNAELTAKLDTLTEFIKVEKNNNVRMPTWVLEKTEYIFYIKLLVTLVLLLIVFIIFLAGQSASETGLQLSQI